MEPRMIRRQFSEMDVRCSRSLYALSHLNGILYLECVPPKEASMALILKPIIVCRSVSTIRHSLASEKNTALHKLLSDWPQAVTSRIRPVASTLSCGVFSLFSRPVASQFLWYNRVGRSVRAEIAVNTALRSPSVHHVLYTYWSSSGSNHSIQRYQGTPEVGEAVGIFRHYQNHGTLGECSYQERHRPRRGDPQRCLPYI